MYVHILIVPFLQLLQFFIRLSDCFELFIWQITEEGVLMSHLRLVEAFLYKMLSKYFNRKNIESRKSKLKH